MAKKVKEAVKVVKAPAAKTVEKKPEVCSNCDASGLKCSMCGAADPVV